jgi:hypothetical protein
VSRFNKGKLPSDTEDSEDDKRMATFHKRREGRRVSARHFQGIQSSYYPVARFSLTLTHGPWPFSHTRTLLFIQVDTAEVAADMKIAAAAVVDTAEAAVVDTAETVTRFED